MKKFLTFIVCFLAFNSIVVAQEDMGDKAKEAAHDTAEGTKKVVHAVGDGVKSGAHAVASVAKKAKNQVILQCRNGRHALRRPSACNHAGGVVNPP
jgi:hypothetical protein